MKRNVSLYIDDIKDSICKIEKYVKGITYSHFRKDSKTIDAVVRNLEIIGEAVKNIPADIKKKNSSVPWKQIIGMRNKITHEYFGVDVEVVWETIQKDIPELKNEIRRIKI